MSGIGHPSSTDKESGIQGVASRIQELLDFLTLDEKKEHEFNGCLPFTWQTGRFTVFVNGSRSLGLVNFVPESRIPLVQISSIYRKTAAKA